MGCTSEDDQVLLVGRPGLDPGTLRVFLEGAAVDLVDRCQANLQQRPRGAELMFQILTEREERSSVATATNLPFSEWGKIVPDARLVAAIIDRLTFHAHIIETGSDSYRLRTTKAKRTR